MVPLYRNIDIVHSKSLNKGELEYYKVKRSKQIVNESYRGFFYLKEKPSRGQIF